MAEKSYHFLDICRRIWPEFEAPNQSPVAPAPKVLTHYESVLIALCDVVAVGKTIHIFLKAFEDVGNALLHLSRQGTNMLLK